MSEEARITRLEARLEAMSALVKTVLATLVLRGTLTKAAVDEILAEAKSALGDADGGEIAAVARDMPAVMREAMGPAPDEDDHDH